MRRRDVYILAGVQSRRERQPVGVERQRNNAGRARSEDVARVGIARIFDADRHLRRIELAVDEWIRVFLPILGLDDVALTRDREAHPRFPSGRGWRVGERRRPGTRRCAASEDFGVDEMATAALGPQITLI